MHRARSSSGSCGCWRRRLDKLNGISRWYSPEGPLTVAALTDRYVRLALEGLLGAG